MVVLIACLVLSSMPAFAQSSQPPTATASVVSGLKQAQWRELEDGLEVIRTITPAGLVLTAYRISPKQFEFSFVTQINDTGSRAKTIGEREGAVLVSNAGFFAVNSSGKLYSIGYLRLNGTVLSKGWNEAGGTITLAENEILLQPTHAGIPQNKYDVLQSRPMLIEPGAQWAMGSNSGTPKLRTLLCTLSDGTVVLATVTRVGLTLFEAGWIFRKPSEGGFFGCDSAIALDGGRSTQIWHSGEPGYSFVGITPVHNFIVVRQRENQ